MNLLTLIPELLNSGIPPIENIIDKLPNHPSKKYIKRDLSKVTTLVVHHMASEAPLINQANYHVNGRGWARIGYHIVIANNKVYQTNYLDTESYHTSGHNRTGIGIAILGDLSKRNITQLERDLLTAVLVSLHALFPNAQIKGHNQLTATSCPATDMNKIREDVSTLENKLELEAALNENLQGQLLNAAALHTRVNDLYAKAAAPGKYQVEAIKKLSRVANIMRGEGLL